MNIFTLAGTIMVDNTEANKSISKTSKEAEGLGGKLANGAKTAAKWAAGVGAAATAVGGAMVAAAKDTAADLDVIDKASIRMGITAESYQELAHAAGLCGVEMTTMEKAAKKLEGTDLNMDDALDQIMAIGDEGERTQKAIELFGESVAYQMTPLLQAGQDGMSSMRQEAHDLGLVMSGEAVANGTAMNDMFSKVSESIATLKNGLVSDLMPYVMEILQWVIDNIPTIKETISSVMDAVLPIVKPIIEAVMSFLPPLMSAIKTFMDWILPYIKPVIDGVVAFVNGIMSLFNGDFSGFLEGIKTLLINLGSALWGIGGDIITSLWDGIKEIWTKVSGWFEEKVAWITDKLSFWKKSNDEMVTEEPVPAHASGLAYVPYDGYRATLHRGERVLTASEAAGYGNRTTANTFNLTVNAAPGQDPKETARVVANELARMMKRQEVAFT